MMTRREFLAALLTVAPIGAALGAARPRPASVTTKATVLGAGLTDDGKILRLVAMPSGSWTVERWTGSDWEVGGRWGELHDFATRVIDLNADGRPLPIVPA